MIASNDGLFEIQYKNLGKNIQIMLIKYKDEWLTYSKAGVLRMYQGSTLKAERSSGTKTFALNYFHASYEVRFVF
jgi:hypothetical protein